MAPVMRGVHSSHVERIGHDPETKELVVIWDTGKTSIYEGVPADVAHDVQNAWSVGKALTQQVKGTYKHRYRE